jgi:hypothetical protein
MHSLSVKARIKSASLQVFCSVRQAEDVCCEVVLGPQQQLQDDKHNMQTDRQEKEHMLALWRCGVWL